MESIFDGTWASGPWPEEMTVVDILLETGWSWREWMDTPPYVRQVTADYIHARRQRQADEANRQ